MPDGRRRRARAAAHPRSASEIEKLRKELETTGSEAKIKKIAKRLKVLEGFQKSGIKPDWMVWKCCRCCRRTCVRWCRWTVAVSRPPT
jgi:DNA-directed RNA polymerase beta' subunit